MRDGGRPFRARLQSCSLRIETICVSVNRDCCIRGSFRPLGLGTHGLEWPGLLGQRQFATGGIYAFYWAHKVRRWCEATLEKPNQALWKTIALVVPIFNLFLLFDLAQLVNGACFRASLPRPQVNLPMLALSTFFIDLLWRLPDPYWFLSLFDFIPLTVIYTYMYRSQLRLNGAASAPQKSTWFEWVIVTLGCLVLLFATFGAAVQLRGEASVQSPWFPVVVQVMALFALFLLSRNSAAIVRDALIESKSTLSVER